jgi:hypothetical protein
MPIEFRCPGCNKLLRTADSSAGQDSKCPHCGTPITVPLASDGAPLGQTLPAAAPTAQPVPPAATPSSYQPGRAASAAEHAAASGEYHPQQLVLGEVLNRSWTIFKRNIGVCIGAFILVVVVSVGLNFGIRLLLGGGVRGGNQPGPAEIAGLIGSLAGSIVGLWLHAGMIHLMLKVARGDPSATVSDLFSGTPWIVPLAVGSLLFSIIVGIGFLLLIFPGVILALMLWPYQYLVVDRNLGAMDALSAAKEITRGNKFRFFLLMLVVSLLGMVVAVFTLGLGMIVYGPFVTLLMAVTYLTISGQPTAADGEMP